MYGAALPDLSPLECLHEVWREAGMAAIGANGYIPLSWQELRAFSQMRGRKVEPYEASCIMDMSIAFCNEVADRTSNIAPMDRKQ